MLQLFRKPTSTGGGGPETDPVAMPALTAHKGSGDHDTRNATQYDTAGTAGTAVAGHVGAADPHGDRTAAAAHADAADAAHVAAPDPHGDRNHSDTALTTHVGVVDPHGDRNYADTRIAALVNAAPAALDTLAEIDAQLASDEAGTAAILATQGQHTTSIAANTAAINSETTRAEAAEQTNATTLTNHLNNPAGAHAGSAISFDDTGLIVVKGANVKAALTAIDAWANARPTHESGPITGLPANGARPNNSTYLATDQYGDTPYQMVAGAWVQGAAGVTQASGQAIAGPVQFSAVFDLKAVGAVATDLPGMSINVPASARPVLIKAKFELIAATGTSAANASARGLVMLTDINNAIVDMGAFTAQQGSTAASITLWGQVTLECYLPAPVAAGTYKVRAQLNAAAPANWTSFQIQPSYGQGVGVPRDNLYAVTI